MTDVGSTTGEAVAFAVLKILRSKHDQELFLKMENNRVRSAFIGWLGSYGTPYCAKQKGACSLNAWGGIMIQKSPKDLGKIANNFLAILLNSKTRDSARRRVARAEFGNDCCLLR